MKPAVVDRRLRGLIEAGIALASELSLEALLQQLTETAAELTGASYAALGVIDATGSRLERFITHGIDPETRARIGELPQGRGILGVLLHKAEPLRLHDLAEDPRSVGFPPNHPPMRSFLGVPILLRGVAFGNLYLTEKADGADFSAEDEELVTLLAAQAAVAIENARLYEAATRWSAQLESLNEVGNALATETDLDTLLDLVVRRLRELLDARLVTVLLPEGADSLRFAAAAGEGSAGLAGQMMRRAESKSGRVLTERRSARVDSVLEDPEIDQEVTRRLATTTGLWVPLLVRDRAIGVLAVHDKLGSAGGRFSDDDLRLAETYASRAAVAVDLSAQVARETLRQVIAAQEVERRRLARELHDETGQALASILLGLRSLENDLVGSDAHAVAGRVRELAVNTLQDVRRLAVELHPKALDDFGLVTALKRLTETWSESIHITIDFTANIDEKDLTSEVATGVYRIVQEALTNVVKHAQAGHVSVLLTRKNGTVRTVIEDDGQGFDADRTSGFGIQGMRERATLLDGRLQIESAAGTGTTLVVEVPLT